MFIKVICSQCHTIWSLYIKSHDDVFTITHYKSKNLLSFNDVCWCWKLTSCNLSIKYCMFNTSTIENSKNVPLQHLIAVGHTRMFEEAWLLVSVCHPQYSPPYALLSNLNPNGLPYPMPNPSTQQYCIFASTISYPTNGTYYSIGISSLLRFKREMRFANSFVAPFILDFSRSLYMVKLALQFACKIWESSNCFRWLGIHFSQHLKAPHNSMP